MIHKSTKTIITIASHLFIVLLSANCDEQRTMDVMHKIKTVELGMTKDEVIEILGSPLKEVEYKKNGVLYITMLYEAPNRLESTAPSVVICKETGLVVQIIVDDSGNYDKRAGLANPCLDSIDFDQ